MKGFQSEGVGAVSVARLHEFHLGVWRLKLPAMVPAACLLGGPVARATAEDLCRHATAAESRCARVRTASVVAALQLHALMQHG